METVEVDLRLNLKLSHSFYSVWMAIHSLRSTLSLPTSQGFKETTMGITRSACTFVHSLPFVYMDLWRILLFFAPRGVAREGVLLQGLERGLEKSFRVFGIHPCYTFLTLATRRSATLHSSVPDGISGPVFLSSSAGKSKALPGAGPARPQCEKPAPQKAWRHAGPAQSGRDFRGRLGTL
jgi:hypothetical protein